MTAITEPWPFPDPAPRPPDGYLDAVAGQPLLPVAAQAWLAAMDQGWSDPARLHHEGRRAGLLLDAARERFAHHLGIRPADVFLAPSGPSAAAVGVQGLLERSGVPSRAIVSAVESLAVTGPARRWAREVEVVPVHRSGAIDLDALAAALAVPAALVCVQAASGEVGTRQPLTEVARLARAAGVPLLVHAVQVIGRGPVPDQWDLLAASARDWGGPPGVGLLAVRPEVRWTPEENPDRGWVGGFPDIPAAAAAATAWDYLAPVADLEAGRAFALVDTVRSALPDVDPGILVAGDAHDRLPHIVTFTVADASGEALVHEMAARGLSVASGSACTSDTRMPSQVLAAMGLPAHTSIRVSLPLGVAAATVDRFLEALPAAIRSVRG